MTAITVVRYGGLAEFRATVEAWLTEREAAHNLPLGILGALAEAPVTEEDPPYLAAARRSETIVAVVVRTPPWRLVLSEVDDPACLEILADRLAADDPDLPGVVGPVEHAGVLAQHLGRRLGRPATRGMSERAFELRAVIPPRPAAGRARMGTPDDRALILGWLEAFDDEAFGETRVAVGAEARVDQALARVGSRRIWLWEDGHPVSLTGIGGPTPNGIRLGPVYTPSAYRGRGYASNLVAAASRHALDGGRRAVYLFTDIANATSNHIYQAIGYRPVRDVEEWSLGPPSGPADA
jgi:predicted GNAT family acetyltransferase